MGQIRCEKCYYCEVCKPIKDQNVRANCKDFKQGKRRKEDYWREMSYYKFRDKSIQQRLREGE